MSATPLDAVISGTAFEDATTAIGVLEKGSEGTGKISLEMLCTLDNFIQTVLFNEHIYLTVSPWIQNGQIIPGGTQYRGGLPGRKLIDAAAIFAGLPPKLSDPEPLRSLVDEILKPVEAQKSDWFVINCARPKQSLVIFQEMASMDAYLMEDAIAQAGVHRFKPVFPGEHLYLGLRAARTQMPRVTQTMPDMVTTRIRSTIRDKMAKLNVFVSQGAPIVPESPPIYVSRVLRDCATGADFVPTLLKIRNSPAFRHLRAWLSKCATQALSPDPAERMKAADAWQKFMEFPLDKAVDKTEVGVGILNVAVDIAKADVVGILSEVASPIVNYFLSIPFAGIREFSGDKADSGKLAAFLAATFGDQFNRGEMNMISAFLDLPASMKDWPGYDSQLTVTSGRIYPQNDPLARSFTMQIRDPAILSEIMADIEARKATATIHPA